MMKGNVRKFHEKAKQLLKFYSLWQETRQEHFERQYLKLLSEILAVEPGFSLRQEFQKAF